MVIPVRVSYRYKNYPFAPKATAKSKNLGIFTSAGMMIIYAVLFMGIIYSILYNIKVESQLCLIISIALIVPFILGIRQLKKARIKKIDQMAEEETKRNLALCELVQHGVRNLPVPFTKDVIKEKIPVFSDNASVNFVLQKLVNMGKLKQEGKGKNIRYYPV